MRQNLCTESCCNPILSVSHTLWLVTRCYLQGNSRSIFLTEILWWCLNFYWIDVVWRASMILKYRNTEHNLFFKPEQCHNVNATVSDSYKESAYLLNVTDRQEKDGLYQLWGTHILSEASVIVDLFRQKYRREHSAENSIWFPPAPFKLFTG